MQLTYAQNGSVRLRIWNGDEQKLLFQDSLYQKKVSTPAQVLTERPDFRDSTTMAVAGTQYRAGGFKRWLLGENYRDVWEAPVQVPIFDLQTQRGGLRILKQGGGMQTKSLRLENKQEKQYVLRSVNKYAENAIPELLRKTFAAEIVQDQISASHPYGAFVIPPMAEAIGIYHTNPKPYLLPDDPLLGDYRATFGGMLVLHEERPHKEQADQPFFTGGQEEAENIESTPETIEEIREDNDNRVDEDFVVRNRLFDMVIGDWDRHDDQWRFTQFDDPDGKGNLYRPIPRDRDQVFFINEGIIPWLAARRWALPKVEGFDEKMNWAPGFNHNARFFDRTFMTQPDWSDWQDEVRYIQQNLTDSVIEAAIRSWPDTVFALSGARTIRVLKARRDDLMRYARQHYEFLSREVEVRGTDKHEYFLVERLDEQRTRVTVRKRKKDGERKHIIYRRTFLGAETREIRLFGLDGEDVFEIRGEVKRGIRVRIIGGKDADVIRDRSRVAGLSRQTVVYDRRKNTELVPSRETKNRLSRHPEVNEYDRKSFRYDVVLPLLNLQFNRDDGLFLGGGFDATIHRWRREPYAARHQFLGNFAVATGSFNGKYRVHLPQLFRKWGVFGEAEAQVPFFASNYFGLGNETTWVFDEEESLTEDPIDYYRIRLVQLRLLSGLSRPVGRYGRLRLGGTFRQLKVDQQDNTFYTSAESDLDLQKVTRFHRYGGFRFGFEWDSRDELRMPSRGLRLHLQSEQLFGLDSRSEDLSRLRGSLAFYLSARLPARLVLATRVGVEHLMNETFTFFNAPTLGGRTNLRGYRRTRFYGQTSFYHNLDLRLKLFSFRSYLLPGTLGLLGFQDVGRVWLQGEDSDRWHVGRGVGLWLAPANKAVLSFTLAFTKEETLPAVRLGFLF